MRKITHKIATAFRDQVKASSGNSCTDGNNLFLHGNLIAYRVQHGTELGRVAMTLAGWNTPTTRERLNGLLEVLGWDRTLGRSFHQHKFEAHFGPDDISSNDWLLFDIPAQTVRNCKGAAPAPLAY